MSERDEAAAGKPVAASFRCGRGVVGGGACGRSAHLSAHLLVVLTHLCAATPIYWRLGGWADVVTRWVSVRACVLLLRVVLGAPGVGGLFSPVLLCRVWCGLSDSAFVLVCACSAPDP